jgi:hypothetical protein
MYIFIYYSHFWQKIRCVVQLTVKKCVENVLKFWETVEIILENSPLLKVFPIHYL